MKLRKDKSLENFLSTGANDRSAEVLGSLLDDVGLDGRKVRENAMDMYIYSCSTSLLNIHHIQEITEKVFPPNRLCFPDR